MVYRPEWIGGCCTSTTMAPFFYEGAAMEPIYAGHVPSLDEIIQKREELFARANDPHSGISCLKCAFLVEKDMSEVRFDTLNYLDLQHYTTCNNRCTYCVYAQRGYFVPAKYDVLAHLEVFARAGKLSRGCIVLFNGGEPALLRDLDRYMDFFHQHGVVVELYTNGTIFKQSIYDHIASGNIIRTLISVDAGNASTYRRVHGTDSYDQVIANLARYSHAAEKSGSLVQAKYIFTEDNADDENITGFVHAMLAIRPQVVLLMMNFEHLQLSAQDRGEGSRHSYDAEVEGYARMFLRFKQHGWPLNHVVEYIRLVEAGRQLVDRTMNRIRELEQQMDHDPRLALRGFRRQSLASLVHSGPLAAHFERLFPRGSTQHHQLGRAVRVVRGQLMRFTRRKRHASQ
jgi:organic radical activating enzyme